MSEWASPDPGAATPAVPASGAPAPAAQQQWGSVPQWAQPTKRGVVPLRPLTLGEILDGAITMVRRYPRPLLGFGAVAAVVTALVELLQLGGSNDSSGSRFALTIVGYGVSLLVGIALSGAAAVLLRAAMLGDPMTMSEVLTALRPRFWRLVGVAFLSTFLAICSLPAVVFFLIAWSLAGAAVAMEGCGVREGMRRSRRLVKGAWWRTFGIELLAGAIVRVVATVFQVPALVALGVSGGLFSTDSSEISFGGQLAISLAAGVATLVTAPFSTSVRALIYADRRMRVEGLDVALRQALEQRDAS